MKRFLLETLPEWAAGWGLAILLTIVIIVLSVYPK